MRGVRRAERVSYGLLVRLASCVHAFSPEVTGGVNPYLRRWKSVQRTITV